MKIYASLAVLLFVAVVGIAQEITPQRGVSFNATGILPAHDHSSASNGGVAGNTKIAATNSGDQTTAITINNNAASETTYSPVLAFHKRTASNGHANVGAVLGRILFRSFQGLPADSAEIVSTARVQGSGSSFTTAGDLDLRTAPGSSPAGPQSRLYISEAGAATFSSSVTISGNAHTMGTLGVGIAAPATKLHMVGDGSSSELRNVSGATIGFWDCSGSGNQCYQGTRSPDSISWYTNTIFRMWLDGASGNLGIGTASPATTLDVNGNAQFGSGATKSTFTATGFWEPYSRTRAQIDTLVPTKVGQVIYASDTTLPGLCVSTGTLAAQWRKMESATLGCGTNN